VAANEDSTNSTAGGKDVGVSTTFKEGTYRTDAQELESSDANEEVSDDGTGQKSTLINDEEEAIPTLLMMMRRLFQ
jgi:hypothetical protein